MGKVRSLVREALERDLPAYDVFTQGISRGMDIVGGRYEAGEYFLTELLGAAQIADEAMRELAPYLKGRPVEGIGTVVLGTVEGDIHDIGKNIVKMLMTSTGFEVYDLGTDVTPGKFAERAGETDANIVAMSSLLTTTMIGMRNVMYELEKLGLRGGLKVIIGGAPITDEFASEIGADGAAKDAGHGVRLCKDWMGKA
jgi:5-methyltetrahydrofolate--homocysteine methyltransferase